MSITAVLEEPHEPPKPLRLVGDRASTGDEPDPSAGTGAKRSVLIVEDEPALRETLRVIFQFQGFETVEAADGEAALQILNSRDVDVLILDLHLPKLDGVSVLQRMGSPPPMVIIHSAFEFYPADQFAAGVGSKVFRMIRKPSPPPELIAAVSDAVAELERQED